MSNQIGVLEGILGLVVIFVAEHFFRKAIRKFGGWISQGVHSMLRPISDALHRREELKKVQAARKSQGLPPWENPHI